MSVTVRSIRTKAFCSCQQLQALSSFFFPFIFVFCGLFVTECRSRVGRVDCLVIHDVEEAEGQEPLHPRGTRAHLAGAVDDIVGQGAGGYAALEKLRRTGAISCFGAGINLATGDKSHTSETYRKWNLE